VGSLSDASGLCTSSTRRADCSISRLALLAPRHQVQRKGAFFQGAAHGPRQIDGRREAPHMACSHQEGRRTP